MDIRKEVLLRLIVILIYYVCLVMYCRLLIFFIIESGGWVTSLEERFVYVVYFLYVCSGNIFRAFNTSLKDLIILLFHNLILFFFLFHYVLVHKRSFAFYELPSSFFGFF